MNDKEKTNSEKISDLFEKVTVNLTACIKAINILSEEEIKMLETEKFRKFRRQLKMLNVLVDDINKEVEE